ncbi:8646_t:CDS:2, partial [Rhizophagus irregularis]
ILKNPVKYIGEGFMVGLFAEASGIAKMVTAVSCAKVSQLTVIIGGNFGNYGCNRRTCGYQSFEMNKLRVF